MVTLAINWHGILTGVTVLVFVVVSVLMILTVLIQRPAGGGLSGAFGSGAGSGQTAFGTKTGDALTIATITMFVLFLLFAIVLNFMARPTTDLPAPPAVSAPVESGSTQPAAPAEQPGTGTTPATPPPGPTTPPAEQPSSTPPSEPSSQPAQSPTTPP